MRLRVKQKALQEPFFIVAFFTFASTAKSIAIAILFFFFSLFFPVAVLGHASYLCIFFYCRFKNCDQDRNYWYSMRRAFKPSLSEISSNSNGGLKREHLESCFSDTKDISPLSQCLWLPNFLGLWLNMRGYLSFKVIWHFHHVVLEDHVTN